MIKNWILLSIRRFRRNKTNSLINILGLSLGIIVYLLIFIYVMHEFSYDNFHKDSSRVFRLIKENPPSQDNYNGKTKQAVLPGPLADIIRAQIAGVQHVTRLATWGTIVVETDGKTFYEDAYHAADPDLFKILTFTEVDGVAAHALEKPNTVAISETAAIKYFGTIHAVGKVIELTGFKQLGGYTVDFVFKDFPSNSSYQFNIILQFVDFVKIIQPGDLEAWNNWNYNYLLKTGEKIKSVEVENQIKQFFVKKYEGSSDGDEFLKTNFLLEPILDSYLKSDVNFSNTPKNDLNRLYMLATIAVFVLIVAGINYVNLTTARSVKRAKEVGIRKVSGAFQSNLIFQFLLDALSISCISMVVAVIVAWTLFPSYRDFIGKPISLNFDPWLVISIFAIPILLGLLAGLYPAFVLSSFMAAKVLKGNFGHSNDGNATRDILTVFQFTISGGLIIGVFIISQQLTFIEKHNPGYDREHILRVGLTDVGVRTKRDVFVEELRKHPNIVATSIASYFPNAVNTQQGRDWNGPNGTTKVSFYTTHADYNYIDLFNIKIIKGRNFSPDNVNDKNAFLINETAAKVYGWDDPVGMQFTGENGGKAGDTVHIIGVIKDMHISSYRSPIVPFRIGLMNDWCWQVAIKIKPTDIPATLSYIEESYKKLATTKLPFQISFFDEDFGKVYKTDRQLGKLINIFSVIAIVIACLGLYGLAVHTTNQRLKEIGIRKIMGASFAQISYMLSRKFVILVMLAFIIATPVAYYVMHEWLQTFAYHVTLEVSAFVITAVMMVLIALLTVGSQTWRAATSNPTEVLRGE
jgi:putative ABC transport system permease protein